jgi:penicillin-binding protein 1A
MNPKTKAVSSISSGKRKQRSQVKSFIFTVIKLVVIFLISISCVLVGLVGGAIYGYIKTASPIKPEQLQLKNLTSFIYDANNKEIAQLKGEQNRVLVDHDYIPDHLRNAFIAIEDKRFYDHNGIDIVRIGSAVYNFLKPGGNSHGGSTITQQLVRNITGDTKRTLKRKVQEQWMAIQLEKHIRKDKILDLYMNLIYMGGNYYGVQAASKAYFGKNVKDLTLAQCASLAGITNMPGWYAPVTDENRKKNKERQETILKEMRELNYISEQEYQQALKEDLKFVIKDKSTEKTTSSQSYFVDQVITEVKKDLVASGMSPQIADKTIYNNGLKIYTTLDSDIQKAMDDVFMDDKYFPVYNKLAHAQAAMAIIDPKTGHIKALRGGYGQKTGDLVLNRATQIQRPPGSTFKPIAVYAPAIDQKIITAATVIDDVPTYLNGISKGKYPQNYTKTSYGGLTTIHDALVRSTNVVAAKAWMKLGPKLSLKYLERDGIKLDITKDGSVSIAMGGLTTGVSPLQMAAAYVPFVNDGKYIQPTTYTRVEDMNGNVLLEKKPKTTVVYDNEGTSHIMVNMMKDVTTRSDGTAASVIKIKNGQMPTAGKTGTTSDNKDKWFVGYTPYYVAATWYGYDKNYKLDSREYNQALVLWNAVMDKVHANLPVKSFPEPKGVVKKAVCKYSGKVASDLCGRDPRGNSIKEEYFIKGSEPKDYDVCDVHVLANICQDCKDSLKKNLLVGPNCPATSIIEQVFTKRTEPYIPAVAGDPYPSDWAYEIPSGLCTIHGGLNLNTGTADIIDNTEGTGITGDINNPGSTTGTNDTGNANNTGQTLDPITDTTNNINQPAGN